MKNLILITIAPTMNMSCNENNEPTLSSKNDSVAVDSNVMRIQVPETSCYRFVSNKDTVALKVEKFPNVVTGNLVYALHEKDRNRGDIEGVFKGDTLVADYTFLSEGSKSVRQVIFLIQNNTATEGYGDMKDENGKMVFKDPGKIDFTTGLRLNKVSCLE